MRTSPWVVLPPNRTLFLNSTQADPQPEGDSNLMHHAVVKFISRCPPGIGREQLPFSAGICRVQLRPLFRPVSTIPNLFKPGWAKRSAKRLRLVYRFTRAAGLSRIVGLKRTGVSHRSLKDKFLAPGNFHPVPRHRPLCPLQPWALPAERPRRANRHAVPPEPLLNYQTF